jgi:hypothetical protein
VCIQNGKEAACQIDNACITASTRQSVVKLTVHKLVDAFGWYPRAQQVTRLAVLLGEILHMPSNVFYDPKSYDGYIPRFLQNLRRKLPGLHEIPKFC